MKYIIVNSVKGGCGKSSISLHTAIDLALDDQDDNNVLVIDMDILGSSLRTFVTGQQRGFDQKTDESEKEPQEKDDNLKNNLKIGGKSITNRARWLLPYEKDKDTTPKQENLSKELCFTDLFYKKYDEWKDKEIEIPFCICSNEEEGKKDPMLYIAFSSEDQNVKNRFRTQKSNNYTLNVNVRYYEEILRKYIKHLGEKALSKKGIATHVIFDMPPNSDPYSECVYSILLKILNEDIQKGKEGDNTVELRLVSSCDLAHISANLSWVSNMFEKNGWQYGFPSELVFVINDITGAANVLENSTVKEATITKVSQDVRNSPFFEQYGDKAKILWNDRDELLIFSSANKSCVSFSRKEFESRSIPAQSQGNSSRSNGSVDGAGKAKENPTEDTMSSDPSESEYKDNSEE